MPLFNPATVDTGTTILNGAVPPTPLIGAGGNYYVDYTGQDLYGPKLSGLYGPAVTGYEDNIPNLSYGSPLCNGNKFKVVAGQITGLRFYRNVSEPAPLSRQARLYSGTGTLLATSVASSEGVGTSGWVEVALPTPVTVVADQLVVAVIDYPVLYVYGNTNTTVNPEITWMAGQFSGTLGGFPGTDGGSYTYGTDLIFTPLAADPWPLAVPGETGVPPGSTILNGTGAPDDALGNVGEYYLDQGVALYGPKTEGVSYGPGVHAIPAASTPTPGYSHATLEIGDYINFTADGRISAVRYWFDNTTTQLARKVNIWTTGGTRLATASVASDGGGAVSGWKELTLDTPLDVTAGQTVVVSLGNTNAYSRQDSATLPVNDGHPVSLTQGVYAASLDVFPNTVATTINFFIDVVFHEISSDIWPIAVEGV